MLKKIIKHSASTLLWPLLPNGIYCFNYHRVGNQDSNKFDPNIYSCTAEIFEEHLLFFKKEFHVISVDDMIIMKEQGFPIDKKYAVITFDDGYIDNYLIAYPLLKKHGLTAAFYIATDYVNSPTIPWWDHVGWIIRHSKKKVFKLSNWEEVINISALSISDAQRVILKILKADDQRSMKEKVAELESVTSCSMSQNSEQLSLFVNWEQVIEMSNAGMHIGSHTMSHQMLSHLNKDEQIFEIRESKKIIEEKIGKIVTSIAYPVGGLDSFGEDTVRYTKEADYKLGFTFLPGINKDLNDISSFKINRFSIDNNASSKEIKNTIIFNR